MKCELVYRDFPLGFNNPLAQKEAEATEGANELGGDDIFWKYADLIYERTNSNGNIAPAITPTITAAFKSKTPNNFQLKPIFIIVR